MSQRNSISAPHRCLALIIETHACALLSLIPLRDSERLGRRRRRARFDRDACRSTTFPIGFAPGRDLHDHQLEILDGVGRSVRLIWSPASRGGDESARFACGASPSPHARRRRAEAPAGDNLAWGRRGEARDTQAYTFCKLV